MNEVFHSFNTVHQYVQKLQTKLYALTILTNGCLTKN